MERTSTGGSFTTASGGTLDFEGGAFTMSGVSFSGDGVFEVASGITLDFVGGASTLSGASFEGDGTLLMSGGSTTLKSGATVSVADLSETGSGTSMTVSEALTYAGDFSQGAGSTTAISSADELSLTGTASLSGTTSGAGRWRLPAGAQPSAAARKLSVSHWSISGAGTDVTLDENLTYAGSFSEGANDTLVLSGGYLLLSGANRFVRRRDSGRLEIPLYQGDDDGLRFHDRGTVEWENTKTVTESGETTMTIGDSSGDKAFLDNTATGTYDILDDSGIDRGSSTASDIKNAGLFEKTGGTGVSTIVPAVTNTGTIEVTAATLYFEGAIIRHGNGHDPKRRDA